MVTGSNDRRDTVDTSWKAAGNVDTQNSVVRDSVETLEESEDLGIQRLGRVERSHLLHCNMTMAVDDTTGQLLWSGEVSIGCVCE
jgi:hypothetical protein